MKTNTELLIQIDHNITRTPTIVLDKRTVVEHFVGHWSFTTGD